MKEFKAMARIKPTAMRGKWFEINDLNHMATDIHIYIGHTATLILHRLIPTSSLYTHY
jgi:hypothetical protein